MRKDISQQIKFIRKKVELSQNRFGKKIGVSGKTISAYENGKITPPLKVLERISTTYDVNSLGVKSENLKKLENEIQKAQESLKNIWEIIGVE